MSKKIENPTLVEDPALVQVTNEELLALHTAQDSVIAELQAKIAELEKEKAAASKAGGGVIVTLDDIQYRVVHGLLYGSGKKSPAEIAADPELCLSLLASGSSALQPI